MENQASGHQTRSQSDSRQYRRDKNECDRVGCADAVQQRHHQSRQRCRRSETDANTDADEGHAIADYKLQHFAAACAERHPNSDLVSPLGDRVRDNSVNPNRRQNQCHTREETEQNSVQTTLRDHPAEQLIHRANMGYSLIAVH